MYKPKAVSHGVEPLESRAYAALVSESYSTVYNDPNPSQVVTAFKAGERPTVAKVSAKVDGGGSLRVVGTPGDDSFRIRTIGGGRVEIRTYTRESFTFRKGNKYHPQSQATTTLESVYVFRRDEFGSMSIEGAEGGDTVRISRLPFTPYAYSVESQNISDSAHRAPDGQTPSDSIRTGAYAPKSAWWKRAAAQKAAADVSKAAVAFFGDSHAAFFQTVGSAGWKAHFPRALNLGIGGDSTRQLLTRIEDGLFDVFKPKVLVVSVGTNNFNNPATAGTDPQVLEGVLKVVSELRARLPETKLVLIGLLPRTGVGQAERAMTLNQMLTDAASDNGFAFVDPYARFSKDQHSKSEFGALVASDSHYTPRGYWMLAYQLDELFRTF